MPFGFSLVSLDADKVEPLVLLAAGGAAIWYFWTRSQAQANAAAASADPTANLVAQAENAALLQSLFGSTAGTTAQAGSSGGATYSAPATTTGTASGTTPITGTATVTSTPQVVSPIANPGQSAYTAQASYASQPAPSTSGSLVSTGAGPLGTV